MRSLSPAARDAGLDRAYGEVSDAIELTHRVGFDLME